jgi:hypothetical protein
MNIAGGILMFILGVGAALIAFFAWRQCAPAMLNSSPLTTGGIPLTTIG